MKVGLKNSFSKDFPRRNNFVVSKSGSFGTYSGCLDRGFAEVAIAAKALSPGSGSLQEFKRFAGHFFLNSTDNQIKRKIKSYQTTVSVFFRTKTGVFFSKENHV